MKITDVQIMVYVENKQVPVWNVEIGPAASAEREFIVCKILTDEGVEGISGSYPFGVDSKAITHSIIANFKHRMIGEDPLNHEKIWQKLWKADRLAYTSQFALGIVDCALWDLKGKVANMPVYRLLGGYRNKIPAYASSQSMPSVGAYIEEVQRCLDLGYPAYKLHPVGDAKLDAEVSIAVRKAVGDNVDLMLDGVAAYDYIEALKLGRTLEELNFLWYEEPLRDTDLYSYRKLTEALDIPIAGTEFIGGSVYAIPEYIQTQAVDIVRADPAFKGGITGVMKIAHLAEAYGMRLENHVTASEWQNMANLHIQCAIKNTTYFEILVPEEDVRTYALQSIDIDKEGFVTVPEAPGLGYEIDWDFINKRILYKL